MTASTVITAIIKAHLAPLLKSRGFTGRGATYCRKWGETIQIVYLQRGAGGSGVLYLNGGAYVGALDRLLGYPVVEAQQESQCHVRLRPQDIDADAPARYDITSDSDGDRLGAQIVGDLAQLLDALDGFDGPDAAVRHLAQRRLAQYERVFGWFLHNGETAAARDFVRGLHTHFGGEARWANLAGKLDAVAAHLGHDADWRAWIAS